MNNTWVTKVKGFNLYDIQVNFVVKGETPDEAINTLVKLANFDHATESDEVFECLILDERMLEPHEVQEYLEEVEP